MTGDLTLDQATVLGALLRVRLAARTLEEESIDLAIPAESIAAPVAGTVSDVTADRLRRSRAIGARAGRLANATQDAVDHLLAVDRDLASAAG